MKIDKWRTRQHNDLIVVAVQDITDANEIVVDITGSDGDDDDMYAFARLNVADAIQLYQALRQAIGVVLVKEIGGNDG